MSHNDLQCYFNGCDLVIAESEQDATAVLCEHLGERLEDYQGTFDWKQKAKSGRLCIEVEHDLQVESKFKTVAEWIREFGRGFLASTEW